MSFNSSINNPLVSVLMTAYNRENYIAEAIESVLASTYTNFELIIVDDGSVDNTVHIARNYEQSDSRIKVFVNENNLGDYPNRNRAASYAVGEYLKYLDADDTIYRHGLEVMVNYMIKYPEAAFALSLHLIDDIKPYPFLINSVDIIRSEYMYRSYLSAGPSASIIKKDAFEAVGGFSGKQYVGDTELWLKLASKYSIVVMNPSLIWYRSHPDQQIKSEYKKPQILIDRLKISIEYLLLNKNYFSESEFTYAIKKRKQHFSRMVFSILIRRRNLNKFIYLLKNSGLNLSDWLSGFRGYYK